MRLWASRWQCSEVAHQVFEIQEQRHAIHIGARMLISYFNNWSVAPLESLALEYTYADTWRNLRAEKFQAGQNQSDRI